jgi:cytochrome c-type biogenesis protein CcmH
MRRWRGLLPAALLMVMALSAGAIDTMPDFEDAALQARYERLIHELRCLQCQNNSIADSPGGLAADLRRSVHDLLREGKTDQQIMAFMTGRYGDFVLYRPPFVPRTWLLWLAPVLLLGAGVLIAWRVVSGRARLVNSDTEEFDEEPENR